MAWFTSLVGALSGSSAASADTWNLPLEVANDPASNELLRASRYCVLLTGADDQSDMNGVTTQAWNALERDMALVPSGETRLVRLEEVIVAAESNEQPPAERVNVRATYLDRCAVSNRQFARFVAGGGYRNTNLWPTEILPFVLQCVDTTNVPGPRFWSHGKPPQEKLDHPVVGISWYEAQAYAQWMGKRLPTPAEWQRAGTWCAPDALSGAEGKYPWGNAFDPARANLWSAGNYDTVRVDDFQTGATANGVYQLIGNVWEWVAAVMGQATTAANTQVVFQQPMAEIRGGAFDSYFAGQATCQFRSAQPLMTRLANVGFRCCVSADHLRSRPISSDILE